MIFKHSKTESPAVYGCMEIAAGLFLGAIACLVISLCACKAQKQIEYQRDSIQVPVVVTQEHTIEHLKIDHIRDTLIQRDSIYHYIKGDTTIIERWHYTTNNNVQIRVDTLHKVDSVPVPVEVVREHVQVKTEIKEVNKLTWAQKTLMGIGGIALLAGCIFILLKIRRK